MPTYIEYKLEDGSTFLIAAPEISGIVPATRGDSENIILESKKTFDQALEGIKHSAISIKNKLAELMPCEVKVKFGITTTGELGIFAIGKVGAETNYEVTLKWKDEIIKQT